MTAYYNEHDPFAARWLRQLMRGGLIAPGDIDTRDIRDVAPAELGGYVQCHFFAGIGVWSYALRQGGWPDDRPVWTGSCPCQPFSAAGKRAGTADERHLWPAWQWLIQQCRPDTVFGEQVASRDGCAWLDLVCTDLEGCGYAVGAADLPAAGFGAPHIRQRLYFVAHAEATERRWKPTGGSDGRRGPEAGGRGREGDVANSIGAGLEGRPQQPARQERAAPERGSHPVVLADSESAATRAGDDLQPGEPNDRSGGELGDATTQRREEGGTDTASTQLVTGSGAVMEHAKGEQVGIPGQPRESRATGGFWAGADWIDCTDGKSRPVEPGTFPLVTRTPSRVGRLRGYGNALCAPVAIEFVKAALEALS